VAQAVETPSTDELLLEYSDDGVATLTINRPQRKNAIPPTHWELLRAIFHDVMQSDARVLVITGAGDAFCAGADLSGTGGDGQARGSAMDGMHPVNAAATALHQLRQPTIAKVNGVAVGAGMNLALGCDLVVAGESARFSEIFVKRALSVDFGGTWLLPRLVGMHKAKELALFGDILSAQQAAELGIVNRVVPDAELDAFVDDWAGRLASGPPLAMQQTKRMLSNSFSTSFAEALSAEAAAQTVNFGSRDTAEGVAAFIQKRPPVFEGR
jgi:enoyl-CoA hydratase/carnithine racemase